MYKPKLKYLCAVANPRSLWPQTTLIKYMNSYGITPRVICQLPQDIETIKRTNLGVEFVNSIGEIPSDYDVMFSQSAGLDPFEKECLLKSHELGKTNIKLHNSMSTYNTLVNIHYTEQRVAGRIDGICMREQRAIDHFKRFNNKVFYLKTGDPDWDYLKTPEFHTSSSELVSKNGKKVLLICNSFDYGETEGVFIRLIVKWAEEIGFKVFIRIHPGNERNTPPDLLKYIAPNVHRYTMLASVSHVIGEMASTIIGECHMIGIKVGSYPFAPHTVKYAQHEWVDNLPMWKAKIEKQVGYELLSKVPFVHTTGTLKEFLSNSTPIVSPSEVDKIWGWPKAESYSSYLFECLEGKLGA
jgi:hypothetical protein